MLKQKFHCLVSNRILYWGTYLRVFGSLFICLFFPGWKHNIKQLPNCSLTWQNRIGVPYWSPTLVSADFFDTLSHHWIPKQLMLLIHYGHITFLLIFNCFGFLKLIFNEIQVDTWWFFKIQNKYLNMIKLLKVLLAEMAQNAEFYSYNLVT